MYLRQQFIEFYNIGLLNIKNHYKNIKPIKPTAPVIKIL